MAVMNDRVYVLEANPRASRTIPFLAKATGYPMIAWSLRAALGESVKEIVQDDVVPGNYRLPGHGYAVKTPVFPFSKFRDFDPVLGPEMKSTGEVMGMDASPGTAFAKAFLGAGIQLPRTGSVLFSVRDQEKARALGIARVFELLGFKIVGTPGTASYLKRAGINCESVAKIGQSTLDEDLLATIRDRRVQLIVNTTSSTDSLRDAVTIRKAAVRYRIPLMSTLSGAEMASMAIQSLLRSGILSPVAVQDFIPRIEGAQDKLEV
jgi:carbamoyl-phosphate synthase large subunit